MKHTASTAIILTMVIVGSLFLLWIGVYRWLANSGPSIDDMRVQISEVTSLPISEILHKGGKPSRETVAVFTSTTKGMVEMGDEMPSRWRKGTNDERNSAIRLIRQATKKTESELGLTRDSSMNIYGGRHYTLVAFTTGEEVVLLYMGMVVW